MTRSPLNQNDLNRMASFGCRLATMPEDQLRPRRREHNRRLIREAGLPLQRHRISDDGILAAYEALRKRENGGG